MPRLRSYCMIALTALLTLGLTAGIAQAKPKKDKWKHKHHKVHNRHSHDCGYPPGLAKKGHMPPGLAKQGKVPPGWSKKCRDGHYDPEYHTHDRDNQDYGYHHERSQPHTSPCRRIYEGESEKGRVIAGTTAAGATMGGLIGSATGDTTSGAVLGGVVGGLIGANADTNKVNRKTILGGC